MQIKITQEGFESFTGAIGNVEFVDGTSVGHVSKLEAGTIGGLYTIEVVDADAVMEVAEKVEVVKTAPVKTPAVKTVEVQTQVETTTTVETEVVTETEVDAEADAEVETDTADEADDQADETVVKE